MGLSDNYYKSITELMKNHIEDYFLEHIDAPYDTIAHTGLQYNTLYSDMPVTFLDGIINFVRHKACFIIDSKESNADDEVSASLRNTSGDWNWHQVVCTKRQLLDIILSGEKEMYHTSFGCFNSDVVILSQFSSDDSSDGLNRFMFFYYGRNSLDSMIGKFVTEDSLEHVSASVKHWLDSLVVDNDIIGYTELPASFLKGWIKY